LDAHQNGAVIGALNARLPRDYRGKRPDLRPGATFQKTLECYFVAPKLRNRSAVFAVFARGAESGGFMLRIVARWGHNALFFATALLVYAVFILLAK
jgi:hypothetical protein